MPTIFEKEGYRFFFYSNDHQPVHVHVRRGGGEAVFDVRDEIALRESQGLKLQEDEGAGACRREQGPYYQEVA